MRISSRIRLYDRPSATADRDGVRDRVVRDDVVRDGLVVDRLIPEVADTGDASLSADTGIPADDMSIAVLPFADMSEEQDQQHFTDGLSEELLNLLVRVDGCW